MTEEHITRGLQAQFDRHRIVFWYDAKQELREAFDEVSLPDVTKIEIQNDEFSIKHRVLKQGTRSEVPYLQARSRTGKADRQLAVRCADGTRGVSGYANTGITC